MDLLNEDTAWAFISGSDEERFLDDILWGINSLLLREVPQENIFIFIDKCSEIDYLSFFNFPFGLNIFSTHELFTGTQFSNFSNLVLVVTGHGDHTGITAPESISPHKLLSFLKTYENLKFGLIVLGQCFAGTFNYLEARKFDNTTKTVVSPEICIIGATNLSFSISVTTDITGQKLLDDYSYDRIWLANLFLFLFMFFIAKPLDIDGDGDTTLMDAYKFAGIFTNQKLLAIKKNALLTFYKTLLTSTINELTQGVLSKELEEKAKKDLVIATEEILINQDPWVLNANLARKLHV